MMAGHAIRCPCRNLRVSRPLTRPQIESAASCTLPAAVLLIIYIKQKGENLVGNMASQGTTPRQLTDLIGSLCDLTSGSGDKGTPIIWIQGYFDNYTAE